MEHFVAYKEYIAIILDYNSLVHSNIQCGRLKYKSHNIINYHQYDISEKTNEKKKKKMSGNYLDVKEEKEEKWKKTKKQ